MHVVVFANGELSPTEVVRRGAAAADWVVCADGGADHASAMGVHPDVLIGDMDSVSPALRVKLESQGVESIVHPANKDETDLELALLYAVEHGATRITILGALGRRIDHELGNLLLLAHPCLAGVDVCIMAGDQEIWLIRQRRVFDGAVGDLLSLLPIGGDARGVTTSGLEYPLDDETLHFGPARGVSNVFIDPRPGVRVQEGLLLAVHTRLT